VAAEWLTADSGYLSEANITYCAAHGIDAYLAVRRKGDDDASLGRLPMTQARELQWEMHQKVSTPRGRAVCLCHNMLKLRRTLGVLRLSAVAA
jgi:hypothetical protein